MSAARRLTSLAAHVVAAETETTPVEVVDPATLNIHADADAPLSDTEIETFLSDGYVVLPGVLGDGAGSYNEALKAIQQGHQLQLTKLRSHLFGSTRSPWQAL